MAATPHEPMIGTTKLTYEDLLTLPEDGKRYEILDGDLLVTPSPLTRHQIISTNLVALLHAHVKRNGLGIVLHAPTDVILDAYTVLEPDILYVRSSRADIIQRHAIVGPPDLVVEILSPSTAARDRGIKLKAYARFGIEHYWIIDPDQNVLEAFSRTGEGYALDGRHAGNVVVHLAPFADLALDLAEVWE